jgi:hypothetical protein
VKSVQVIRTEGRLVLHFEDLSLPHTVDHPAEGILVIRAAGDGRVIGVEIAAQALEEHPGLATLFDEAEKALDDVDAGRTLSWVGSPAGSGSRLTTRCSPGGTSRPRSRPPGTSCAPDHATPRPPGGDDLLDYQVIPDPSAAEIEALRKAEQGVLWTSLVRRSNTPTNWWRPSCSDWR